MNGLLCSKKHDILRERSREKNQQDECKSVTHFIMKFIYYFNVRTFLALLISQVAAFLVITYQIKFSFNILLFGIAVVFPLHFSIQAAFKRRDRALEFFSLFKGGALALHYSFQAAEDLSTEGKQEARGHLKRMADSLFNQLENRIKSYQPFQQIL